MSRNFTVFVWVKFQSGKKQEKVFSLREILKKTLTI